MPTHHEAAGSEEMPSEVERAKVAFVRKLSDEIKYGLYWTDAKSAEAFASFVSNTVAERLMKRQELFLAEPTKLVELLEGMPSMHGIQTSVKSSGEVNIVNLEHTVLDDAQQQAAFEEMVRAQLLMRAADVSYEGNGHKNKQSGGGSDPLHLVDWLKIYGSLRGGEQNKKSVNKGRVSINFDFPTETDTELMAAAYEADVELFADTMIAFGVREGAAKNGRSFQKAWKQMHGQGYDNYGVAFQLSTEDLPYRAGNRKEDTTLVAEKARTFGGGEAKVKTYKDLTSEVETLQRANRALDEKNAEVPKLQSEVETLQSDLNVVTHREKTTQTDLAKEREARASAEAKVVALEKRIQDLLAIAEEKVGMLSKDTRAVRARQLADSPLVEGT